MQARTILPILCLVMLTAEATTPVQKVITMLNDMLTKGRAALEEEKVNFGAYSQWCVDIDRQKDIAINKSNQELEDLEADIQQSKTDISSLSEEIFELTNNIGTWSNDKKAASDVRGKEATDFSATHTDYAESLSAINRAIQVLKQQNYDRKQAESFVQVVASLRSVSAQDKQVLKSFLADDVTELTNEAPEANAYEFQSGGVIDLLRRLDQKFTDELRTLEKEETNAKHAFEQMTQQLTGEINQAEASLSRKQGSKGKAQKNLAEAQGDHVSTLQVRDDDVKYRSDAKAMCSTKDVDFAARQKLRAEELEALAKAVEILGSDDVKGNAETHLPSLLQRSFVQVNISEGGNKAKALQFLQKMSAKLGSRNLALLCEKVDADPFAKVRKMVRDLVFKLKQEALAEAEQKGWCSAELAANKQTREAKTEAVDSLSAEKEELEATITKLAQTTSDLAKEVSDIQAAMAKATETRQAEKKENQATIVDAKASQEAVAQALEVLRTFYDGAKDATALVQQAPADDAPGSFGHAYTGMQDNAGGVVGMIEVIQSDFVRLETETRSAETSAQRQYETFTQDSKVDLAVKQTTIANNEEKSSRLSSDLVNTKKDLEGTQVELDAALAYHDKLKPTCVSTGVTYEERVQRREEEIQSLKEAMTILEGTEVDM